jgi:hypothetical protein
MTMDRSRTASRGDRIAIVRWTAGMGAVTAEAIAVRQRTSVAAARSRLVAAASEGLLSRRRPLVGQPALYAITSSGVEAAGLRGLGPCRVSASNALHLIVCAQSAVALELRYPGHRVIGERELRLIEGEHGAPVASAQLPRGPAGGPTLHRPDLVLLPTHSDGRPVAVEVELTVKAPRRLAGICRAWARSRLVAGVLYLAPSEVGRALERAIAKVHAGELIVVAPLDALVEPGAAGGRPERTIAGDP